MNETSVPTLRLGITMAGAVSAGAYTAGVIDYLFEALYKWEEEKAKEAHLPPKDKTVPPHCVQIDVIGGASAGGITAALSAVTCYSGIVPVNDPVVAGEQEFKPINNLLFDTWVNLGGGEEDDSVIRRMLKTNDLHCDCAPAVVSNSKSNVLVEPEEPLCECGIPSLLNSDTIDLVAKNAIQHATSPVLKGKWPSFVAQDLEVLLTLCSLRGVPVGIDFNSNNSSWSAAPSHQMSIHKQYARFTTGRLNNINRAMPVTVNTPGDSGLNQLIECAKATAAFPIGLKARDIKLSKEHIRHQFGSFLRLEKGALDKIFHDKFPERFKFTSVDGGTLNNEPFGEISAIMRERGIEDFAMILVDPFPNFGDDEKEYKFQRYLKNLAPSILAALRNQGMFKENLFHEISDSRSGATRAEYKKNMIYPSRHLFNKVENKWTKAEYPMACGALGGFAGFLSRTFRHHDYFLGRHNCRNFLRSYFTMEFNEKDPKSCHPIFKDWTPAMRERYKVGWRDEGDIIHLPIIPVIEYMEEEDRVRNTSDRGKFEEIMKAYGRQMSCEFPNATEERLRKLRFPLAWRLFCMTHRMIDNLFSPRNSRKAPLHRKIFAWILKWAARVLLVFLAPFIFFYFSGKVLRVARDGLRKHGLLPKKK